MALPSPNPSTRLLRGGAARGQAHSTQAAGSQWTWGAVRGAAKAQAPRRTDSLGQHAEGTCVPPQGTSLGLADPQCALPVDLGPPSVTVTSCCGLLTPRPPLGTGQISAGGGSSAARDTSLPHPRRPLPDPELEAPPLQLEAPALQPGSVQQGPSQPVPLLCVAPAAH